MNNVRSPLTLVTILFVLSALAGTYFVGYYTSAVVQRLTDARVTSFVDGLALFENRLVQDEALFRDIIARATSEDTTLRSFTAYAPHGDRWRVYVSEGGSGEGAVVDGDATLFAPALTKPYVRSVVRTPSSATGDVTVVRALAPGDIPQLLLVATYTLTDAERARELWVAVFAYLLLGVVVGALVLVGYTTRRMYKKRGLSPTDVQSNPDVLE